jgi:hypothetical protein
MEAIVAAIIGAVGSIVAAIFAARASRVPHVPPRNTGLPSESYQPRAKVEVLRPAGTRLPKWVVIFLSLFIPGLGSLLLRGGKARLAMFLALIATIPVAFVVFGPLWGEILFRSSTRSTREVGLWPFVATCVVTPMISVALAYKDWKVVAGGDA